MAKKKETQLGKLPPNYKLMMNPYPDQQIMRCPLCERKNGQKKLPLLIIIKPLVVVTLPYTSRYCDICNLLIANQHDIESMLAEMMLTKNPDLIGSKYTIVGTVDKQAWRKAMQTQIGTDDFLEHTSDFDVYYDDLRLTRSGYYKDGIEAPVMEPPPSAIWIKGK